MNRYVLAGLLDDARRGLDVLVVSEVHSAARVVLAQMERLTTPEERVARASGHERIVTAGGGSVEFISQRSVRSARGKRCDVIFVDCDVDSEVLSALLPCVHDGELINH